MQAFRKPSARLAVLLVAALLLLTACGGGGGGQSSQGGQGGQPGQSSQGGGETGGGGTAAEYKFAMILPGTVEDADYNFVGYEALKDIEEAFGMTTAYQERVAPADAERVARGFINDGYNIIAFHGGQFLTTVTKLAPEFPDVTFIAETAGDIPDLPDNVWNIGRKFYQGFYALGALAAHATQSGKIGIVVGIELPDFIASINAIKEAVAAEKPEVEVVYTFVGDQNDPVKARQAAEAQINSGVDMIILVVNLGAFGVIEAVQGKPVLLTTYYTDKSNLAPDNFASSLLLDFGVPYKNVVGRIIEGQRSGYEEMRPGNGMSLAPVTNVPAQVGQRVQEVFDQIASGQLQLEEKSDAVID